MDKKLERFQEGSIVDISDIKRIGNNSYSEYKSKLFVVTRNHNNKLACYPMINTEAYNGNNTSFKAKSIYEVKIKSTEYNQLKYDSYVCCGFEPTILNPQDIKQIKNKGTVSKVELNEIICNIAHAYNDLLIDLNLDIEMKEKVIKPKKIKEEKNEKNIIKEISKRNIKVDSLEEARERFSDLQVDYFIVDLIDINSIDEYSSYINTSKGKNYLLEKVCKDIIVNQPSFLFYNDNIKDWKKLSMESIKKFIEKSEIDCWLDKKSSMYISSCNEYLPRIIKEGSFQEKIKELEEIKIERNKNEKNINNSRKA